MLKQARPKWMKMLAGGKASPAGERRLMEFFPARVSRQLERKPLGDGAEGIVMPTFTGQHGRTALKLFFDSPRADRSVQGIISKGKKVTHGLGDASILDRFVLMSRGGANSPFAKIHQLHPRGWVMDRLKPVDPSVGTRATDIPMLVEMLRQGRKENWDATDLRNVTVWLRSALKNRHADREPELKDFIQRLRPFIPLGRDRRKRMPFYTPAYSRDHTLVTAPLGGKQYVAADFKMAPNVEPHNIMRDPTGRLVISDPFFFTPQSLFGRLMGGH